MHLFTLQIPNQALVTCCTCRSGKNKRRWKHLLERRVLSASGSPGRLGCPSNPIEFSTCSCLMLFQRRSELEQRLVVADLILMLPGMLCHVHSSVNPLLKSASQLHLPKAPWIGTSCTKAEACRDLQSPTSACLG